MLCMFSAQRLLSCHEKVWVFKEGVLTFGPYPKTLHT